MNKKESFFINRIKSIGFALKGGLYLIKTEASIKVQFVVAILITILGFYFNISKTEWMAQILAIGMVMSIEGINTAIEEVADFIHPENHKKIGLIKDISAGAVFIASFFSISVGLIIYIPRFF
jgi:diacylglycerol kinase (ATP)